MTYRVSSPSSRTPGESAGAQTLAILEEQLHLMLREWKSELHNPSSVFFCHIFSGKVLCIKAASLCIETASCTETASLDVLFRLDCFMYGGDHSANLLSNLAHICIDSNLSLQVKKEIVGFLHRFHDIVLFK